MAVLLKAFYGYTLLWALLAAVILKWFINREVGRFSVCTTDIFSPSNYYLDAASSNSVNEGSSAS